jgi:ABC-type uncharacterized transport system involved in gliding motility auxiliary subunit
MKHNFSRGQTLVAGITLLAVAVALDAILVDGFAAPLALAVAGALITAWSLYALRTEIGTMLRTRQAAIVLQTAGLIGIVIALAYLSVRFPFRLDMTESGQFSLSEQTVQMLQRLDKPVHITFFYDPMMRESVEFYGLIASQTDQVTVEFHDPMLNPAQARMRGVEFAGTSILESEGRQLQVHTQLETDIANGILRVAQGIQQTVCFLDGHGEPDPFSLESHDHIEGNAGHEHGLGTQFVLHERIGMAKARHSLEAMNYAVKKVSLVKGNQSLADCAVLVVAGPRTALLASELRAVDRYIADGKNALFMLDPFVRTGLEPMLRKLGVIVDDTMVIDEASYFQTDISSPAITNYNRHQITTDLPLTFFPGARSLSPTPQRVTDTVVRPLINSSRDSFGETDPRRADFDRDKEMAGPLTIMVFVNKDPSFVRATQAVVRKLMEAPGPQASEKEEEPAPSGPASRIAVIGDSDFATNSFFHILGNGRLFLNTINYLAVQENLIGLEPQTHDLPRVNLTNRQMKGTFFLSIILIPALMLVIGFAVWWRQR